MAKLPALMEALRKYVHHETPAIRYAARELRERQLLTLGPGGRGSPDMTTRDAVNLALALTVSIDSSRYADTVETLNSLKRVEKVAPPRWAKWATGSQVKLLKPKNMSKAIKPGTRYLALMG